MSLVPFGDRDARRVLAREEQASHLEQVRAYAQGRRVSIEERIAYADASRRIDNGYELVELILMRSTRLHRLIAATPDEDLRELFGGALEATVFAALGRARRYMAGD